MSMGGHRTRTPLLFDLAGHETASEQPAPQGLRTRRTLVAGESIPPATLQLLPFPRIQPRRRVSQRRAAAARLRGAGTVHSRATNRGSSLTG